MASSGLASGFRESLPVGLTVGFGSAAAFAVVAWLTHLPWIDLRAGLAGPVILASWCITLVLLGRMIPHNRAPIAGLIAGSSAALLMLIPLGSTMVEQPPEGMPSPGASGVSGGALMRAGGFLVFAIVLGVIGTTIGSRLSNATAIPARRWLGRFAIVACVMTFPLIVIGGLVTSTNAGMAFPDWPTSDGANMFLYPLSLLASPDRFLEHSHRLYGAIVGLTVLTLMLFTLAVERSRGFRIAAVALFIGVCVQGIFGGTRVTEDLAMLRIVHGFTAQIFLACLVGFAAALSPVWGAEVSIAPSPLLRKLKFCSTLALHSCVLQHLLGAMYRHMKYGESSGVMHVLYTHALVAMVVLIGAILAVIIAGSVQGSAGAFDKPIRRWSTVVGVSVAIQFLLGWGAFFAVTQDKEVLTAPSAITTAITTAHQANGAVLLASLMGLWLWARHAWKRSKSSAIASA